MASLSELKVQLKNLIAEDGIAATLKALKQILPEQSSKYEDILLIESRQNETNRQRLRNLLDNDALQIAYSRIRDDLMQLINDLKEEDFKETQEKNVDTDKGRKSGSLLHRIPDQMELNKETKCIVRIALSQDIVIEEIDLDEHVTLEDISVSDLMQVELIDPNFDPAFTIRTINSAEQFIDEHAFTEWIFYVKPLRNGVFPLVIKVAVIELIYGKERKREIVLEESIEILAKSFEQESSTFKAADFKLTFKEESVPQKPMPRAPGRIETVPLTDQNIQQEKVQPQPIEQKKKPFYTSLMVQRLSIGLVAVSILAFGGNLFYNSIGIGELDPGKNNAPDSLILDNAKEVVKDSTINLELENK